jgi:hypothetical protein|tara:strand:+ start:36613 stop:36870 length:258 start_codon:yes stop_codon:yes gene_type:complete
MVRKKDLSKRFFYVQCGDWDCMTIASSHFNACLNAMDQAIEQFGEDISLTDVIISSDCDNTINSKEDAVEGFLVERILKELSYEH